MSPVLLEEYGCLSGNSEPTAIGAFKCFIQRSDGLQHKSVLFPGLQGRSRRRMRRQQIHKRDGVGIQRPPDEFPLDSNVVCAIPSCLATASTKAKLTMKLYWPPNCP